MIDVELACSINQLASRTLPDCWISNPLSPPMHPVLQGTAGRLTTVPGEIEGGLCGYLALHPGKKKSEYL
jgi:hypothetical protein